MTAHGSNNEVRAWPADLEAREALETYLAERAEQDTPLDGMELDFRGADLSNLDLCCAYLLSATLTGVSLVGADLFSATLSGASLVGADLSGAELGKAEAIECEARTAVFKGADLFKADFTGAVLHSANLREAKLSAASFSRADLRNADLRCCRFSDLFLRGARMHGARLDGAGGLVKGPVDVGEFVPRMLDGHELTEWFHAHGAPEVSAIDTSAARSARQADEPHALRSLWDRITGGRRERRDE